MRVFHFRKLFIFIILFIDSFSFILFYVYSYWDYDLFIGYHIRIYDIGSHISNGITITML